MPTTTLPLFNSPNRRKFRLVVLLLLLLASPVVRAQTWQTAFAFGGNETYVTATTADANGNVYITGHFSGTTTFGNITLTGIGNSDAFIAKWSPSTASFVWAQKAGGGGYDTGTAIVVSGQNVYVTGSYSSPNASFGTITLNNPSSAGSADVFVAKLTDTGASSSFTWAQRAGGDRSDEPFALAVSGTSVYIAGYFHSPTAVFGTSSLSSTGGGLTNTGNAFVAKLTDAGSTGSFAWALSTGGVSSAVAKALAVNGPDVYVAGNFSGSAVSFGSTILATNTASEDAFVAKLTDTGSAASFTWAQQAGGDSGDQALKLAVSGTSVYVAGFFSGVSASFGSTVLTNADPNTSFGSTTDIFIAKLIDAGPTSSFAWAQRAGGPADDIPAAFVMNGASLYLTGYYAGATASFGTTTLTNTIPRGKNIFIAKLLTTGTTASFSWAQQAGGLQHDDARAVAVSGTSVFVAGYITPPASFGNLTANSTTIGAAYLAALTDVTLATKSPSVLAGLSLFPNPAHHTVTVQLPSVPAASQATLTLFDALGRLVRTRHLSLLATGLTTELPLRGLAPGLYQLRVQAGDQQATRSLAVE
jgi:hypothetical protein